MSVQVGATEGEPISSGAILASTCGRTSLAQLPYKYGESISRGRGQHLIGEELLTRVAFTRDRDLAHP